MMSGKECFDVKYLKLACEEGHNFLKNGSEITSSSIDDFTITSGMGPVAPRLELNGRNFA